MKSKINELKKRQTSIGDKEAFARLIMNNIPQIIFWVNDKYEIQGVNKHFLTTYKIPESAAIGKKAHLFTIDINEKDETIHKIGEVFQSRKTIYNHTQHFEIAIKGKRLQLWVRQNYIPLFNTNKEINGVLITTIDISKQKLDEAKLKAYNQQLLRSNKELEQFAYIASHDLRTPLTTIISFIQILKKSAAPKLNQEELQMMDFISKGAQNMEQLVNAILEFSKINNGEIKLETIVLAEVMETIQSEIQAILKVKNATLHFKEIPETIIADKVKIKQLLQNLITNAVKFSKKGVDPIIKIFGIENANYWQFQIVDNGIGLEEAYSDKIFKLFQRLHNATEYEGTGIGLSLCKKIVDLHEGEIWVESELGKGSTFHFTIKKLAQTAKQEKMLGNLF